MELASRPISLANHNHPSRPLSPCQGPYLPSDETNGGMLDGSIFTAKSGTSLSCLSRPPYQTPYQTHDRVFVSLQTNLCIPVLTRFAPPVLVLPVLIAPALVFPPFFGYGSSRD
jgi:hypothetical protein